MTAKVENHKIASSVTDKVEDKQSHALELQECFCESMHIMAANNRY